ncbi:glucocorticoid modulatory element-binding protein 2 [Sardina pilchardus]|uniref:glucocorticoid modulatory element-binding protein 2 n=1 Tax=Sardina pilchardus TaxID=27697 RepID=UPI002E14702F
MASSEVNMHVEEVVVVTTPDGVGQGDAAEDEKESVLVTTELDQPGEELAEESAAAEADSISIPKDTVIVKLSEEVSVEAEVLYPITCGDSKAMLVWKKFVCPGINIKCVQYNEHLISPKEFVYLAGKSTLKDWKRAIRLNGAMLRKIMDSGELDFYQHSKLCSNTCRSTKIDLVGTRASLSSQTSTELAPHTPNTDVNGSPNPLSSEVCEDSTEWVTAIGEDTMNFWRNLNEAGLLEEVTSELQKEMQEALKGLQDRLQQPPLLVADAALLNNVVQSFGMLDLVKKVLASHKSQMDRCREQYTRSLVSLEQQCDEHRKRARELKSRSQTLSSVLMTLAPVATPPPPKRPRLTRAVSVPASINAHQSAASISTALLQSAGSSPVTLTGVPLGRVVSGASPLLSGYTLVTSSPGDALTDASGAALTLQQQPGGALTLQQQPGGALTLQQQPGGALTLQQQPGGALTLQQQPGGALTLQQQPGGALTLQQQPGGALTLQQQPSGGLTLQQQLGGALTLQQQPGGALTLQQQLGGALTLVSADPGGCSSSLGATILKLLSPVQFVTLPPQMAGGAAAPPIATAPALLQGATLLPTATVETVSATVETVTATTTAVETVSAAMETVSAAAAAAAAAAVETVGSQAEDSGESEVKGDEDGPD